MGLLDFAQNRPGFATSGDPHGVKLREAIRGAGVDDCPLCRVLKDSEAARIHWLAYEGLSDGGLRRKVKAARGFCPRHTRLLYGAISEQTRNLSAIADVMHDLVTADLEAVGAARRRARSAKALAARLARALRPAAACPVCVEVDEAEARKAAAFATQLADPGFRELYAASAGALCRPHLLAALPTVRDPDALAALLDKHVARLQAEADDLTELLRKTDYRHAGEPKGDEQGAPLRSIRRFTGTWVR